MSLERERCGGEIKNDEKVKYKTQESLSAGLAFRYGLFVLYVGTSFGYRR